MFSGCNKAEKKRSLSVSSIVQSLREMSIKWPPVMRNVLLRGQLKGRTLAKRNASVNVGSWFINTLKGHLGIREQSLPRGQTVADLKGASVKIRDSHDEKHSSFQLPGEVPTFSLQASVTQPPFHHVSAKILQHYWNIFGEGSIFIYCTHLRAGGCGWGGIAYPSWRPLAPHFSLISKYSDSLHSAD